MQVIFRLPSLVDRIDNLIRATRTQSVDNIAVFVLISLNDCTRRRSRILSPLWECLAGLVQYGDSARIWEAFMRFVTVLLTEADVPFIDRSQNKRVPKHLVTGR